MAVKTGPKQSIAVRRDDIWKRFPHATFVRSEDHSLPDGGKVSTSWIQTSGKYPQVLIRETTTLDRQSGQTSLHQVAMAADHVLVKQGQGTASDFEKELSNVGMKIIAPLSTPGLYIVGFHLADTDSLDQALHQLSGRKQIAFAEPDYLVFSSEVIEDRHIVKKVGDRYLDPLTAGPVPTHKAFNLPAPCADFIAANIKAKTESLPVGTRVLGFDPPYFNSGAGSYGPYLVEQNFKFTLAGGNPDYMYVQNASSAYSPNNGTFYARALSGQHDLTLQHADGLPFAIYSVDVSELGTNFPSPFSITFVGTKSNGQTVSQTFTTDGIIDGSGPVADFQTFQFNSGFTDLVKVVANASGPYMIDNFAVLLQGQETPPTPPPAAPLIYQVTWDAPKHTVGQETAVSGPYAPTTVNFGVPYVRSAIGTMAGPAMELKGGVFSYGTTYQQVQFNLGQQAQLYKIELDAYLDHPDEFTVHVDGNNSYASIYAARFYANGTGSNIGTGGFPQQQVIHLELDLDVAAQTAQLFINGISRSVTTFSQTVTDIQDIRLHLSGNSAASLVGIDNVEISAIGSLALPANTPRLAVTPLQLSFPALPLGGSQTWYLTLKNTGNQTLHVAGITSSQSCFSASAPLPLSIIPGGTYTLPVIFSPLAVGDYTGTLTFASDDPANPSIVVSLTGTGLPIPTLALNPTTIQVTMLPNTTGTKNLTLSNVGAGTLAWSLTGSAVRPSGGGSPDLPFIPSDSYFPILWGLQDPGAGGVGIDAVHAWALNKGSPQVEVAIIDTGIDSSHPDLAANIDTIHGSNFVDGTNTPTDDNGHGTHVAGTIAAVGDNAKGVTGVAMSCKVVALKFLDASGSGYTSDAVDAINYAAAHHFPILSNSWGGGGFSQSLHDAIASCGGLFVAAAGNSANNTDTNPNYPSGYDCSNIVAVAASDEDDQLAYFSNYGNATVDLAAPGMDILSTYYNSSYATLSGTSMATPHVSGTAALLLSKNPSLNPSQLKQMLIYSTDTKPAFAGQMVSNGRLNAYTALRTTFPSWLNPQVNSGAIAAGTSQDLPLSFSTTDLAVGPYSETLSIDSLDALHPHLEVPVTLQVIALSGLNSWEMANFGSGNLLDNLTASTSWGSTASFTHDGISNLMKYALGLNPKQSAILPAQQQIQTGSDGKRYLTLTYDCPSPQPADVTYIVEASNDLSNWSMGTTEVSRTVHGNGTQTVVTRVNTPVTASSHAFIRLRVVH